MKLNRKHKILIVGLGLLGGSYARALSKNGYEVTAITRDQSSVDFALKEGMIKRGAAFVDEELCAEADLVVFDLDKLDYTVDFNNPSTPPTGIDYVFVNGTPALEKGTLTHALTGKVLTRNS